MKQRSGLAPRLAVAVHEAARELEVAVHEDCDLLDQIERLLVQVRLREGRELTDEEYRRYANLCSREREAHLHHLRARRQYDLFWNVINAEMVESA